MSSFGGIGNAILELSGKGDERFLHLAGIVLPQQAQVDALFAHETSGGGLRAAGGEHEPHLRVPSPHEHAHFGPAAAAWRKR